MAKKPSSLKTGRVLADIHINGQRVAPDSLVILPADMADAYVSAGHLDCDPSAVDYCKTVLGVQPVDFAS